MPRKKGPDICNGSWLFCDGQPLATQTGVTYTTKDKLRIVRPDELQGIIAESEDLIFTALAELRSRTAKQNSNARVEMGWLHTAKMVPAGDSSVAASGVTRHGYDLGLGAGTKCVTAAGCKSNQTAKVLR